MENRNVFNVKYPNVFEDDDKDEEVEWVYIKASNSTTRITEETMKNLNIIEIDDDGNEIKK